MTAAKPTAKKTAGGKGASRGGRPSKFDPKYCGLIIEFFDRKPFEYEYVDDEDGNKVLVTTKSGAPVIKPCDFPTFERFAYSIGVHRETLRNWCDVSPEFFAAYKKAEMLQKDILIQNGLTGGYDKTFAIFTAKNVTDMRDKQEVEHSGGVTVTKIVREIVRPENSNA